jgi:hypothetical protein
MLLLEESECEPSQIFDFNPSALNEILRSVFYQNDPAKGGNDKKA